MSRSYGFLSFIAAFENDLFLCRILLACCNMFEGESLYFRRKKVYAYVLYFKT